MLKLETVKERIIKMNKNKTIKDFKTQLKELKWQNFLLLTVAGMVNAFGVIMFLSPVKLFDGGISGTSMLISRYTPEFITLSIVLVVLNIPIFLFGLKKEGLVFTIYSIYAVIMYSFFAWVITDVLPVDVSNASPLAQQDLFLCAIFGGIISGMGSGLTIRFGGAIDGIDVLAVMFAKKLGLSIGTFTMTYNVILYIICGIVMNSWILPLYSIVTYALGSKVIDLVVEGFDRSEAAMIVTTKPDEICAALSEEFENGVTTIAAKGYYSQTDKTIIYFVVNHFQVSLMKQIVHKHDPKAYIAINEVADVFSSNMSVK